MNGDDAFVTSVRDVLQIKNEGNRPLFIVVVEKEGVFHRLVEDGLTR